MIIFVTFVLTDIRLYYHERKLHIIDKFRIYLAVNKTNIKIFLLKFSKMCSLCFFQSLPV